jgi:hypothetical protein
MRDGPAQEFGSSELLAEATRSSYEEAAAMASFLPFPPEVYAHRAVLRPAA